MSGKTVQAILAEIREKYPDPEHQKVIFRLAAAVDKDIQQTRPRTLH